MARTGKCRSNVPSTDERAVSRTRTQPGPPGTQRGARKRLAGLSGTSGWRANGDERRSVRRRASCAGSLTQVRPPAQGAQVPKATEASAQAKAAGRPEVRSAVEERRRKPERQRQASNPTSSEQAATVAGAESTRDIVAAERAQGRRARRAGSLGNVRGHRKGKAKAAPEQTESKRGQLERRVRRVKARRTRINRRQRRAT